MAAPLLGGDPSAIPQMLCAARNAALKIGPGQVGHVEGAGAEIHAALAGDQFWLVLPKNVVFPRKDQSLRQAMALAVDRQKINEIVHVDLQGWSGNDIHRNGINTEFLPYTAIRDAARAEALLPKAGYGTGVTLPARCFCPSFPEEPRLYPIVNERLAEAGTTLSFEERPCDGFKPFVTAVNAPIGRPRRNLSGPRNPFTRLSGLSPRNASEPGGRTCP